MTNDDARPRARRQRQEGRRARRRPHRRHHGGQAHPRADPALPSAALITKVAVDIEPDHTLPGLVVRATVKVTGQTGVEMEALTAVSVACLTIYDMVKAVERGMRIEGIRLVEKRGGKSGHYRGEGVSRAALMSVAEALRARARRRRRRCPPKPRRSHDAHGRVLAADLAAHAHPAAGRCLRDGRLCGARRRRRERAGDAQGDRRGRGRASVRRRGRRRRGRAHLHRRRGAARRRHRRDPGEHRRATATRVIVNAAGASAAGTSAAPGSISRKATCCSPRAAGSPTAT